MRVIIFSLITASLAASSFSTTPDKYHKARKAVTEALRSIMDWTCDGFEQEQSAVARNLLTHNSVVERLILNENVMKLAQAREETTRGMVNPNIQIAVNRYLESSPMEKVTIATLQEISPYAALATVRMLGPAGDAEQAFAKKFKTNHEIQTEAIARFLGARKIEKIAVANLLTDKFEESDGMEEWPQGDNPNARINLDDLTNKLKKTFRTAGTSLGKLFEEFAKTKISSRRHDDEKAVPIHRFDNEYKDTDYNYENNEDTVYRRHEEPYSERRPAPTITYQEIPKKLIPQIISQLGDHYPKNSLPEKMRLIRITGLPQNVEEHSSEEK